MEMVVTPAEVALRLSEAFVSLPMVGPVCRKSRDPISALILESRDETQLVFHSSASGYRQTL